MSHSRLAWAAGDLYISPKHTADDWKALKMGTAAQPDWPRAIDIFHDRINGRFLAPVKAMRNHGDDYIAEFSGFTIVAVDCLLIETLGQFYHGFDRTPSPKDRVLNPTGKMHKDFYVDFMRGFSALAKPQCFDTARKCELFYEHFRCGILHQAQTKKRSRVRFGVVQMVTFADDADESQGLIVDRDRLHDALVDEFQAYKEVLRAGTDIPKRNRFIQKMDFIAS